MRSHNESDGVGVEKDEELRFMGDLGIGTCPASDILLEVDLREEDAETDAEDWIEAMEMRLMLFG